MTGKWTKVRQSFSPQRLFLSISIPASDYVEIGPQDLQRCLEVALFSLNKATNQQLNFIFYSEAIQQIARISRALVSFCCSLTSLGSLLLIFLFDTRLSQDTNELGPLPVVWRGMRFEPGAVATNYTASSL